MPATPAPVASRPPVTPVPPRRNMELKARDAGPEPTLRPALAAGAEVRGVLVQHLGRLRRTVMPGELLPRSFGEREPPA